MSGFKTDSYTGINQEQYLNLIKRVSYLEEKGKDQDTRLKAIERFTTEVEKPAIINLYQEPKNSNVFPRKEMEGEKYEMAIEHENISKRTYHRVYSMREIKQNSKDRYGVVLGENPSRKEERRIIKIWIERINKKSDFLLSNIRDLNSKLEKTLEEINAIKQKSY